MMLFVFSLVVITVACKSEETIKEEWEETSPTFTTEYGEMFGKEGSIGIIGMKTITDAGQKWMWHFWGTENISHKEWKVKAFKQGEKEAINPIKFEDEQLVPRNDGNEIIKGHARSTVLFPSSGLWKLEIYIDGEYFDDMIVDITQE